MASFEYIATILCLIIPLTKAFIFEEYWSKDPPALCIIAFEYCQYACPDCSVCHNSLIKCSEAIYNAIPQKKDELFKDICVRQLEICKDSCYECNRCYPEFLDCKAREESKLDPFGGVTVDAITAKPPKESEYVNENLNPEWPAGLEISVPGDVVFIIDRRVNGTVIQTINDNGTIVNIEERKK